MYIFPQSSVRRWCFLLRNFKDPFKKPWELYKLVYICEISSRLYVCRLPTREKSYAGGSLASNATSTSLTSLNMLLRVLAISCRYCGLTTSRVPRQITYISPDGLFLLALAPSKIQGGEMRKNVFPANRGRGEFVSVNGVGPRFSPFVDSGVDRTPRLVTRSPRS